MHNLDLKELARIIYEDMKKGAVEPAPRKETNTNEELQLPTEVYHDRT